MIAEAVDAAYSVAWALLAWCVLTAVAVTLALWTVVVAVAWPCTAAREAVGGALAASRAARALAEEPERFRPARGRSGPSWAAPCGIASPRMGPDAPGSAPIRRWSAPQAFSGARDVRDAPEASESRTGDPGPREAA